MTLARKVQMGAAGAVGGVVWTNPDIPNTSYDNVTLNTSLQEPSTTNKGPGLFFKPDGTKMFIVGNANKTVYAYTLSTAWDLSTASYASNSVSVSTQNTGILRNNLSFDPTGTKMYTLCAISGNSYIFQYTLSTAWDVSTVSSDGVSVLIQPPYSGTSTESYINGMFFNPMGTKMYFLGTNGRAVYEYSLSTPFDITTATYPSSPVPSTTSYYFLNTGVDPFNPLFKQPAALFFKPDGSKMYISDSGNAAGNQGLHGAVFQFSV